MAEALARHGARRHQGRPSDTLNAAVAPLREVGLCVESMPAEGDVQTTSAAIGSSAARHGRLDILMCNAGIRHRKPLAESAEIGGVAVCLAAPAGSYLHGHLLAVDAGLISVA